MSEMPHEIEVMDIPDGIAVLHMLASDGRWLCQVPRRKLRSVAIPPNGAIEGGEDDEILQCEACWQALRLQRGLPVRATSRTAALSLGRR